MHRLRAIAAVGIAFCTVASSASAQMARRDAGHSIAAAAPQTRTPAERLAMSRALLDSARQSLIAGEAMLRGGDIEHASLRLAAARALRAAIVPDQSLASELSAIDAALRNDADAIALGNSVLANAAIPPVPAMSGNAPKGTVAEHAAEPVASETRMRDRVVVPPVPPPPAAPVLPAAVVRPHIASESPARRAALDSAAAVNRRALATSVDVTAPTPGLGSIGGRVLTVRTFESASPPAPFGARAYARRFETAAVRYLYTEVSVGFVREATTPDVELDCRTTLGDSSLVEQPVSVSHESDASIFLFTVGIGWGTGSQLEPGKYVTSCEHDGTPVLADSFTVTGTTAHSAYVAAAASARAGKWVAAAAAYDSATSLDSTVAEYHFGHGVALEKLHDDSAAVDEYATAISLDPDELRYHLQYAGVLHHLGRLDDAVTEYREVIRLDSADARRHMALADLLLESGDRVGALLEYRTAATMDPSERYYAKRVTELEWRD